MRTTAKMKMTAIMKAFNYLMDHHNLELDAFNRGYAAGIEGKGSNRDMLELYERLSSIDRRVKRRVKAAIKKQDAVK